MITLITGTPGSGKTLYTVHAILNEEGKGSRPIFVDGIPELKTRHEPAPDIQTWHEWAPDGALIVIDEVQRHWRPLPTGARIPQSIAELETHRHRGIDFVVITQHPNLMHANVRKLVGRHIHLRRTALGTYLHEWPEATNPEARGNSIRVRWSHPKQSFGLYKSASEHTPVKHRMPMAVYVFGAAVLCLLGGSAYMAINIGQKAGIIEGENHAQANKPQGPLSTVTSPNVTPSDSPPVVDAMHPAIAFMPRFQDDPASAPAYEGLRKVADYPRIASCVASRTRCQCYSQQGTKLDISTTLCKRYAEGKEFDPYRPPQNHALENQTQGIHTATQPGPEPRERAGGFPGV